MIRVTNNSTMVCIDEPTIRVMNEAIAQAKKNGKNKIVISSPFTQIHYRIEVELQPQSMESLGYKVQDEDEDETKDI